MRGRTQLLARDVGVAYPPLQIASQARGPITFPGVIGASIEWCHTAEDTGITGADQAPGPRPTLSGQLSGAYLRRHRWRPAYV